MSQGPRAVRWGPAGFEELAHLGTGGSSFAETSAIAINASGVSTGYARKFISGVEHGARAVRWNAGGTAATELATLGTDSSGYTDCWGRGLNSSGTVVGAGYKWSADDTLGYRPVRWDGTGTAATELGNLGTNSLGITLGIANAVNDAGTAVGWIGKYIDDFCEGEFPVRWDAGGTVATELGNLGTNFGATSGEAYAINSSGDAVGFATKYVNAEDTGPRAVRWNAGATAAIELDALVPANVIFAESRAYDINSAGTVVGFSTKILANGQVRGLRAVRWAAGGTAATELGNLGLSTLGGTMAYAYAINADGVAVGYARLYNAGVLVGERAVMWGLDGVAVDLNSLLSPADAANWRLTLARDISDAGWITGVGSFDPDGTGPAAAYDRLFLIKLPSSTPTCSADIDDDGNFGNGLNPDTGVDINDLLSFLAGFESGNIGVDLDNDGADPATPDGGVDINDLLFFLRHFESGC